MRRNLVFFDDALRVDSSLPAKRGAGPVHGPRVTKDLKSRPLTVNEAAGPLEKLNLGIKGLDAIGVELDALNKRLGALLSKWK